GERITVPGEDISKAIKNLYQTGLFTNIKIVEEGRQGQGILLKIKVQEQPRLEEYKISGVKSSAREDLKKQITIIRGYAVTEASNAQAENTIKRYFKKEGHWDVSVETEVTEPDEVRNRVQVIFRVDTGDRLEIKDITFDGNEEFSDKELRKSLGSIKEDKWWSFFCKKLFKEEDFEEAKENLEAF